MGRKIFAISIIAILILIAYIFFKVENGRDRDYLILYGNVDVRQVDLGFRVSGQVEELYVEEGDLVESGQLLARLDKQPYADQVNEAKARVDSAKANFSNAEQVLKRRQELISDGSISKEDLDNAKATRESQFASLEQAKAAYAIAENNLSYTEIYAPTKGTILTRIREPGSVVNASESVYTLSILSPVWIRAYCTGPELGLIYPGMVAEVFTDTPEGKSYFGKVGFISPVAEFTPKTVETTQLRTDLVYRLRIYVDNPDRGLRQGMPVTVKLNLKPVDSQPNEP